MNFFIRKEKKEDYKITEEVVKEAFANEEYSDQREHRLVASLRNSDEFIPDLSLVALHKDKIIESLALAPVSVLPNYQNKGVGQSLIQKSLEVAEKLNFDSVIVMGHSEYYPKFGFEKASNWCIQAPFEVPDEFLMAIELKKNALDKTSGIIQYSDAFFEWKIYF